MCGICGLWHFDGQPIAPEIITKMSHNLFAYYGVFDYNLTCFYKHKIM